MPSSEQENALLLAPCGAASAPAAKPRPFRFVPPRALIDWRTLNTVDLSSVVRDTDVDALENVLDIVAFGDIEAEDYRTLTPANFIQLFRTAQLTVNYLLHVQDRLAADSCTAKAELARAQQRVRVLDLKAKERKEELAGSRKETRSLKKAMRTLEAVALSRQASPPPPAQQPEVRVVERVVEVPDVVGLRRLEAQVAELEQERQQAQREARELSSRLAAAEASAENACNQERQASDERLRQERLAADERVKEAVQAERRKLRDSEGASPKISVVVASDELPELRSRLAATQRRALEAERRAEAAEAEAARAAAAAKRAAAAPSAELQRLRAQLEMAAAESDMLRSQLAAAERGRSPRRQAGGQPGSGLASELEDVDDAQIRQLEAQVRMLRADLTAAEAARAQLEEQLQQAQHAQPGRAGGAASGLQTKAGDAGIEAEVLAGEVERLRREKAALKEECRRLRQQAAQDAAEIEHLAQRLQLLSPVRAVSRSPSPAKGARLGEAGGGSSRAVSQGARQPGVEGSPTKRGQRQAGQREQAGQPEGGSQQKQSMGAPRGGIGSPIEEPASDGPAPPAVSASPEAQSLAATPTGRQGSRPGSARSRLHREGSRSPGAASPSGPQGTGPSAAEQRQFRRELQHTLHKAERPGVVSRFPHSLGSFLALRPDLEAELEAELAEELRSYGIGPDCEGLTHRQLSEAMAELERRQAEARVAMSPGDRQRYDSMRATVGWHVQRMADLAAGRRSPSPAPQQILAQPPTGLRPIRTASKDAELSPRRRGVVEQVLDQVGDEAAVYSPLARGASALSDHGYLPAWDDHGTGTPRSATPSPGQQLYEDGGVPHSPWSASRGRAFNAALALEGGATWQAESDAASMASSPERGPRSVQFVEEQDGEAGQWGNGGREQLAPAQRMGRRPVYRAEQGTAYGATHATARRLWKEG